MPAKPQKIGKIVLEYLDNPLYTDKPSLTLAKIIFRDHPLEFTLDNIRTRIRYFRGRKGESDRKLLAIRRHAKGDEPINFCPYRMPQPESVDYEPYHLDKKCTSIGVISDLHIPNHRTTPIQSALEYFDKQKINTLIINGDLLDNTPFTRHGGKKPSAQDVKRWFDQAEYMLEYLRTCYPKAEIIWTEGNHDHWFQRWIYEHAWQLGEDEYFTIQERLHVDEYNVKFIPETRYVMAGKLAIAHGHHVVKGIIAPVNAARGVFNKAKASMLIGHVHVESSHTETGLHGDMVTTWSTGCLCTLTPDYQPMAGKACHGFAHIQVEPNGDFHVNNRRIGKNGKIL